MCPDGTPRPSRLTALKEFGSGLADNSPLWCYVLAEAEAWQPTLPSETPGDFRMTDLLRFAQIDPDSRAGEDRIGTPAALVRIRAAETRVSKGLPTGCSRV